MRDPYEVLGVPKSASAEDIKQSYRKLAKKLHPDLNPGNKKAEQSFKEVSAAYDLLSDPEKKARFDRGEIDASGVERQQPFYKAYAEGDEGARYRRFDGDDLTFSGGECLEYLTHTPATPNQFGWHHDKEQPSDYPQRAAAPSWGGRPSSSPAAVPKPRPSEPRPPYQ